MIILIRIVIVLIGIILVVSSPWLIPYQMSLTYSDQDLKTKRGKIVMAVSYIIAIAVGIYAIYWSIFIL